MHHKKVLLLKSELIQVGCHYGNSKMTLRLAYCRFRGDVRMFVSVLFIYGGAAGYPVLIKRRFFRS